VVIEDWRIDYNHCRPHSSLGYKTPAEVGARRAHDVLGGSLHVHGIPSVLIVTGPKIGGRTSFLLFRA